MSARSGVMALMMLIPLAVSASVIDEQLAVYRNSGTSSFSAANGEQLWQQED